MKREDFAYEIYARGYRLYYKGTAIGGVSILSSARGPRGRAVPVQIAEYRRLANNDIENILIGLRGKLRREP